jgi:Rab GDP dissociation inhibitor
MLNKPVTKVLFDETTKKFVGVESAGEIAKAPIVVGDPSYFLVSNKCKEAGKVVRAICLLNHPIPNIAENAKSCQIIIPQSELNRKNDVYVINTSFVHKVCPDGTYIALVSTMVETTNPETELDAGLRLLGPVKAKFVNISPLYVPVEDGSTDNCFISKSMDATTHFESCCNDILDIYRRITGNEYDVDAIPNDSTAEQ